MIQRTPENSVKDSLLQGDLPGAIIWVQRGITHRAVDLHRCKLPFCTSQSFHFVNIQIESCRKYLKFCQEAASQNRRKRGYANDRTHLRTEMTPEDEAASGVISLPKRGIDPTGDPGILGGCPQLNTILKFDHFLF